MRQPKWDQYEAVLLIEAYWKIKENRLLRKTVIAELSEKLRSRAKSQGVMIDEKYRNENGISMRLGELDYLFFGDGIGLKNTSDLFRRMVKLYKNDCNGFEKILMEAKGMSDIKEKTRQQLCEWLAVKAPKVQPDFLFCFLPIAEEFCLKIKVLSAPLFETTDEVIVKRFAKTVSQNKIFRIKNKKQINNIISAANWYYAFVRDFQSITPVEESAKVIPSESTNTVETSNNRIVDFGNIPYLAYTRPEAFTYRGVRDESISNWTMLYVKLFQCFYTDHEGSIPIGQSFYKNGRRDFGAANGMIAPKHIIDDYYLETNYSATEILKKIAALLDICDISTGDVVIEYQQNKSSNEAQDRALLKTDTSIASVNDFDITFSEWLKNIEKMADGTCRSYVSALNKAESYAIERNLPSRIIFGVDSKEALSTIACLMADEDFRRFNQEQHNRFLAAIKKLVKYLNYLHPDGNDSVDIPEISICQKAKAEPRIVAASSELTNELSAFLKTSSEGISIEDILAYFSTYKTQQVNRALLACQSVKVLKKYYHKENISFYYEMADILLDVLIKQFAANGDYTSAQQLYNDTYLRLDDFFFYNNAFESRQEVFDLAVHLFTREKYKGHSFLFLNGKHIWKEEPNYPKDFHGLLIKYAREHQNVFAREQALDFFDSIGSTTPDQSFSNILFNSGSKSFLQYAENCFVLKEALHVNDNFLSALGSQIENLLEGEDYIAFGEIDDYFYSTLPAIPANIQWSPFLMEDVLRIFDIGYITIEAGSDNDKKTIPAAIKKKKSQFRTFSDMVWNEVSKAYSLPVELTSSEFRGFLLDKGFIHGSEKMWNAHKTVAGDLRFYWTEKNSKVTIN